MRKKDKKIENIMLESEKTYEIMEENTVKLEKNDGDDGIFDALNTLFHSQCGMDKDEPDASCEDDDEDYSLNDFDKDDDNNDCDTVDYDDSREIELLEIEAKLSAEDFEYSLAFLDDMVGMEHVKQKLQRLGHYALWKNKLEIKGIDTSTYPEPNLTFMFLGDPGTGKTTVANHMGEILKSMGLLPYNSVHEYRREDLVGQNYGSEEQNTKEALNEAAGGVFFLDEAYQCFKQSTDKKDPGYHILETMMQVFGKPNRCIIMAGYKNEMLELFKVNPGFRSRIPDENIIEFTGPSEQLLNDVANNGFKKMQFSLTPEAQQILQQHIHDMWCNKDKDFGNARVIRQLTEAVVINHANRIMTTAESDDFIINETDIRQSIPQIKKTPTQPHIGFV